MAITINGTTGIAGVDGSASTPAVQGTDTNTGIFFGTDTVTIATGGTTAVTVDSGQRTKFPTTIGVGNATPATSGSGITFPATASASSDANTLDDYEEGTFTPTYYGLSTAGTTTYSIQEGYYTKVGRIVTFYLNLGWSNTTGTGEARIGGLPFTSSSASYPACYGRNDGQAQGGGQLQFYVPINSTTVSINYANLTSGVATEASIDTSVGRIMVTGFYNV